jgi:hypothetical protein
MIWKVKFPFCPRETSQVDHSLASNSFQFKYSCNWVYEPPSFLLKMLVNDVIFVGDSMRT